METTLNTAFVRHLEEALNAVILCTDGEERRLVEIGDGLLHYEVEINGGRWMRLSGTRRREAEPLFVGGTFVANGKEPLPASDLFSVGQWVRVVNWCSKPWIEGPIVSLGTKDSDDLKVRVIRGSTFHRGRVFNMPRRNATPLNDQIQPPDGRE